ncbi:MAG: MMPL family transporter, partial [Planctomycetaceae bacterium]|nr:MMPL family transporter [Planctomycetaceae bacterium]
MFDKLGQFVSRFWGPVLIGWVLLLVVLFRITPPFDSMLKQGEFAFLPDDSDSVQAEALFVKAFPDDLLTSTVVIVARRPARQSGLTEDDRDYIHDTLVPLLRSIGVRSTASEDEPDEAADLKAEKYAKQFQHLKLTEEESNLVYRVRDWTHPRIGHLLNSKHGKATLLIISLTTEYIADDNIPLIWKIDQLRETLKLNVDEELRIPAGMELSLSGTATVGRDMRTASKESGQRTESATIILVLVLLILIYRAPLLAIIPLVTVGVAVATSMLVLSNLASFGVVSLFKDIEVFIKVLVYGAGVDYCLFLIARYKEELDQGATYPQATSASIGKVGAALAASAGTSAIGIGMMSFAEFGKFQQAGNAIFIALMICLLTSLTFAPALIRLCGKWAFWPYLPNESVQRVSWFSPTNLLGRLMKGDVIDRFWVNMCQRIEKAPAKIWVITVSLMLPFAFFGTVFIDQLSYGLLSELPDHYLSVQGARAAQQHFPPGETGPAQVLLSNPSIDFTQSNVINQLELLTEKIKAHREELDVSDIRSVNDPTGITDRAIKHQE